MCPVCEANFVTRLRCIHHIEHSTTSCFEALADGHFLEIAEDERAVLDAEDAKFRKQARKEGRSYLAAKEGPFRPG